MAVPLWTRTKNWAMPTMTKAATPATAPAPLRCEAK